MSIKPRTWKEVKKDLLRDPETASAYDELQEEFSFIASMIEARQKKGLSQADLAARIGTTQGNISRLESGRHNPSMRFLRKVAHALEKELEVSFK
ncbi:MAG: helix-turn-helix transcriptional regulator [Thermovirgaceae bacterium]|jgi:ribosome-binding protein aMBF1 (putative translation factor)|nr:helix-turn-helix transcriptional regulator [Thermovirgaceae bacterium]